MEIEQLRKELNDLLENVVAHSNNYSGNRQIPSLEISYVLKKINKMQETLIVLKYLVNEEEKRGKQRAKNARAEEKALVVKEPIDEKISTPIEKVTESIKEELKKEETPVKLITNMEQLPITKLVDVFSLNDRYLYANELFDKDMAAFNEVVKNIDASTSFDQAQNILMENGTQRNWDVDNEHVLSFTNLVERRFL